MTEIMETDRKKILETHLLLALPHLSKNPTSLEKLLDNLISIGVEDPSEFHLITEDDIDKAILKPIQIRKLKHYVDIQGSTSSAAEQNISHSRVHKSNWVEKFKIDPELFRVSVKSQLLSGKKLSKKARKGAVRDLLDHILKVCPRPLTSQLMDIAGKLHFIYPEAICDKIDGEILGCGYASFGTQLKNRIENMTRDKDNNLPSVRKSKKTKYTRRTDCVNSHPVFELNDKETALKAQEDLKALAHSVNPNSEIVKKLLESSYSLQRADFNNELHGKHLLENWPFLFEVDGIFMHNKFLLQKDLGALFQKFFLENGKKILGYFSRIKSKVSREIMAKYEINSSCNSQNAVACIIHLLMTHFNEKVENIFLCHELGKDVKDIEKNLKAHPCLIVSGKDLFTANALMLTVDHHILNNHIKGSDLIDALAALLGLYYMANIEYPEECACFLEFLQRCAAKINPQESKGKKKHPQINPKVLVLINKLGNFEWSNESDINIIEDISDEN